MTVTMFSLKRPYKMVNYSTEQPNEHCEIIIFQIRTHLSL